MIRLLTMFVVSMALLSGATFSGIITDDMCVKDHKAMKMGQDPDCVRACVDKHGSKYVLSDGKNVYKLSDQETPAKYAAQKVKVTGTLYPKTGIIKVERIEAVK